MAEQEYFVSDGISQGRTWATYRRRASGSLQRVKSPALPERESREEAEIDLARWLHHKAPMTREQRQRRAARSMARGLKLLRQADRPRCKDAPGLRAMADVEFWDAWREMVAGIGEPMDPDHAWYPPAVDVPLLARLRGAGIDDRRMMMEAYDELRTCRVCGCTWTRPCEGGCSWVVWDLCSKCAA